MPQATFSAFLVILGSIAGAILWAVIDIKKEKTRN